MPSIFVPNGGYLCIPGWFLLSDTYEKAGRQDILVEESMEMSEDEADKEKKEDKEEKPLLPPEVFEHLKTAGTEEKKEEKPLKGNNWQIRKNSDVNIKGTLLKVSLVRFNRIGQENNRINNRNNGPSPVNNRDG